MTDVKGKAVNAKDKMLGGVKETVGKVTGNEELELKGKMQAKKAELKEKINIGDKVADIRQGIAGKINDRLDKKKD